MILRRGDMFDWSTEAPDVLLFTANSTVTKDNHLVMGRGSALRAKQTFPGIDKTFGILISGLSDFRPYHLLVVPNNKPPKIIGAFQVKHDFRDDADLELIKASTRHLATQAHGLWSNYKIWLPFPGIGSGRLYREQVYPIIVPYLPDNITVWELPGYHAL